MQLYLWQSPHLGQICFYCKGTKKICYKYNMKPKLNILPEGVGLQFVNYRQYFKTLVMFPISPVSFLMDEYLVTVWYHQCSSTYIKKVVALIQQTDVDRISRDSLASFVFDVYWIGSNGVHICEVFGAPEPRHQACTLNYGSSGQLIWVSDFQQSIQAWLNSNGLFMVWVQKHTNASVCLSP